MLSVVITARKLIIGRGFIICLIIDISLIFRVKVDEIKNSDNNINNTNTNEITTFEGPKRKINI